VNWPAGIVTCGKAKKDLDEGFLTKDEKYEPACKLHLECFNEMDGVLIECLDEPEYCEDMPAHVQVLGKPMMDEELLGIMKVVEDVVKGSA
jgi:amidase